jgi:hypothetical protein
LFNENDLLKKYIFFKKQYGFVKKKDKFLYNILLKINFLKSVKFQNTFAKFKDIKQFDFSKMFEMKRHIFKIFFKNRLFVKELVFFKKHLRQFKLTKIVSKSSKHKLS